MKNAAIIVKKFVKRYEDFVAVSGIDFQVRKSEIFGLLGPNGAGKTSTLECLEGLRIPDEGYIDILGVSPSKNPKELRNLIGVQLQTSGLPASITPREAISLFSAYHNIETNYEILEKFDLIEQMNTQYGVMSGGQQRRLVLALALNHNPPIIILDEPTSGLDVQSRVNLHEIIKEKREQGSTILLATHDMAEAEKLADRVAIMLQGKIVAIGDPKELTSMGSKLSKISVKTSNNCLSNTETIFKDMQVDKKNQEYFVYYSPSPGVDVSKIIKYIESKQDILIDLRIERPSLEERFLELVNQDK